jgi:hypothetical protein
MYSNFSSEVLSKFSIGSSLVHGTDLSSETRTFVVEFKAKARNNLKVEISLQASIY